jgi:hypothetical protein
LAQEYETAGIRPAVFVWRIAVGREPASCHSVEFQFINDRSRFNFARYDEIAGRASVRRVIAALLTLAMATAIAPTFAFAEIRILGSPGGAVGPYLELFETVRQSGQRVVIDGPCYSACTLVLSTVPRERICVTRRAVLGFHAPRWLDKQGRQYAASRETTSTVASTYPADVRAWIDRHGGLKSQPIFLRGRELAAMYPRCS